MEFTHQQLHFLCDCSFYSSLLGVSSVPSGFVSCDDGSFPFPPEQQQIMYYCAFHLKWMTGLYKQHTFSDLPQPAITCHNLPKPANTHVWVLICAFDEIRPFPSSGGLVSVPTTERNRQPHYRRKIWCVQRRFVSTIQRRTMNVFLRTTDTR